MMFVRDMAGLNQRSDVAKFEAMKIEKIQIVAIVITHGAHSVGVVVAERPRVIGGGEDEAIVGRRIIAYIVVDIPIVMSLVPRWAGVLSAHGFEMKRGDWIAGVGNAIAR